MQEPKKEQRMLSRNTVSLTRALAMSCLKLKIGKVLPELGLCYLCNTIDLGTQQRE